MCEIIKYVKQPQFNTKESMIQDYILLAALWQFHLISEPNKVDDYTKDIFDE